ncbi:GNAT family N-acetyltransferase [Nocardioides sp. KIGAM211]|uniref:GNAT family N-acetyltransferase n=1 Tax=Nocardioides luti TaxID=2761101 RepID=A0A7X0RDE9_9ACTN|nr:GNAT family N-acetyltransferase [Nocardioides luti]MBB6626192.1 GNAT family N-acetyltransferase [Nocardioides luti]
MEVLSVSWRSDLALLALGGSTVEHHRNFVAVRSPDRPTATWANFLLLRRRPTTPELGRLDDLFRETFPDARHRAYAVDDPHATPDDLDPLERAGFRVALTEALTAAEPAAPRSPHLSARVRPLHGDTDWQQRVELVAECSGATADTVQRRVATERRIAERSGGCWFGAFEGERMVAGIGTVPTGDGVVRMQAVDVLRDFRGRGLAGTLVHLAGRQAREHPGVERLLVVGSRDGHGLPVYRDLGFRTVERQASAERAGQP